MNEQEVLLQTRHIWQTCFGDSEEFMNIYFSKKYTATANITRHANGKVVAATQVLPYTLCQHGDRMPAGYVSGLATLPEYRGQGLAADILREAHLRLYHSGAILSLLIPGSESLRAYYQDCRHGAYETVAFRHEAPLNIACQPATDVVCTPSQGGDTDEYAFYIEQLMKEPLCLLPSIHDYEAAIMLCRLEKGEIWTARRNEQIVGWMMVIPENEHRSVIRDIRCTDSSVAASLLQHFQENANGPESPIWRKAVPSAHPQSHPYAMARVVNVPLFLQKAAQRNPHLSTIIEITNDKDIPDNNGRYILHQGQCLRTETPCETILTPGELAAWAFTQEGFHLPLMLDE